MKCVTLIETSSRNIRSSFDQTTEISSIDVTAILREDIRRCIAIESDISQFGANHIIIIKNKLHHNKNYY